MTPPDLHEFFAASAGVAGALVGLLFVAISVSGDRLANHADARTYRLRASGTLTAFTNALTVSLFAILPGDKVGWTTLTVSVIGLMFVAGSAISMVRAHALTWRYRRDVVFVLTLAAAFVFQLCYGLAIIAKPGDTNAVDTVAVLVIVFFLVGIARTWELIGGPAFGLTHEIKGLAARGAAGEGPGEASKPQAAED